MTWALSLIPIVAMSVRILLTSHDRYHSVGPWDLPPILALPSSRGDFNAAWRRLGRPARPQTEERGVLLGGAVLQASKRSRRVRYVTIQASICPETSQLLKRLDIPPENLRLRLKGGVRVHRDCHPTHT